MVDELPAGNTVPGITVVVTWAGKVLGAVPVERSTQSSDGWPVYQATVTVPVETEYVIELTGGYGEVRWSTKNGWVAVATASPHQAPA